VNDPSLVLIVVTDLPQ